MSEERNVVAELKAEYDELTNRISSLVTKLRDPEFRSLLINELGSDQQADEYMYEMHDQYMGMLEQRTAIQNRMSIHVNGKPYFG